MKTNTSRFSVLLLVCGLISGCTTTYKPDASLPKLSQIPDSTKAARISFVNGQAATDKIEVSQKGTGYTVYGNLHDWTESAVQALNRALQKKGANAAPGGPKSIKLAVTQATLSSAASGWSFRCTLVFTVDTGDGQPFTLGADDTSWKWPNACDGGIEKLVLVTLHDERVLKALAGQ